MVPDALIHCLALLASLGCGLISGFFFAFSVVVMRALAKQPAPQAIATMQSINVVVLNRWFLGAFFGTAAVCLVALVLAAASRREANAAWLAVGSVLYVVGTIGVTIRFNVPRKAALERVSPSSDNGATLWARYLVTWTAWNHVRGLAAFLAAACFAIGLDD
ncbi:MAG: DUF1772 domain-containing protein [Steroidobacteraceae bacterium]